MVKTCNWEKSRNKKNPVRFAYGPKGSCTVRPAASSEGKGWILRCTGPRGGKYKQLYRTKAAAQRNGCNFVGKSYKYR